MVNGKNLRHIHGDGEGTNGILRKKHFLVLKKIDSTVVMLGTPRVEFFPLLTPRYYGGSEVIFSFSWEDWGRYLLTEIEKRLEKHFRNKIPTMRKWKLKHRIIGAVCRMFWPNNSLSCLGEWTQRYCTSI